MSHKYSYPKQKQEFFKEHYSLCVKWLYRELPDWWENGLKDFIQLARKECGYSQSTFWQDMWHPLKTAFLFYLQSCRKEGSRKLTMKDVPPPQEANMI